MSQNEAWAEHRRGVARRTGAIQNKGSSTCGLHFEARVIDGVKKLVRIGFSEPNFGETPEILRAIAVAIGLNNSLPAFLRVGDAFHGELESIKMIHNFLALYKNIAEVSHHCDTFGYHWVCLKVW